MKQTICSVLGVIGSAIASFFGGWDALTKCLLLFCSIRKCHYQKMNYLKKMGIE